MIGCAGDVCCDCGDKGLGIKPIYCVPVKAKIVEDKLLENKVDVNV